MRDNRVASACGQGNGNPVENARPCPPCARGQHRDPCACPCHKQTQPASSADDLAAAWVQIDAEVHWREPRTPGITFCGEVIDKTAVPVGKPDDQDICERCWNLGCPHG